MSSENIKKLCEILIEALNNQYITKTEMTIQITLSILQFALELTIDENLPIHNLKELTSVISDFTCHDNSHIRNSAFLTSAVLIQKLNETLLPLIPKVFIFILKIIKLKIDNAKISKWHQIKYFVKLSKGWRL